MPANLRRILEDAPIPFNIPEENHETAIVFTDGTAFFAEYPTLAIAGSAVICVSRNQDKILWGKRLLVPGVEQNSFVAELFAVLLALNKYHSVHIHCDCQAVCDLIHKALSGIPRGEVLHHDYDEIWQYIVKHVQCRTPGAIQISKVKAHQDPMRLDDLDLRWKATCNNMVDEQAKASVTNDNFELYKRLEELASQQRKFREQTKSLHSFLGEMSELDMEKKRIAKRDQKHMYNDLKLDDDRLAMPATGFTVQVRVTDDLCFAFPWGPIFLWRIVYYVNNLQWADNGMNAISDVSCLELFVDYVMFTKTYAPINRTTQLQRGRRILNWVLEDLYDGCDAGTTFSLQQQNTAALVDATRALDQKWDQLEQRLTQQDESSSAENRAFAEKTMAALPKLQAMNGNQLGDLEAQMQAQAVQLQAMLLGCRG
eukprot:Skav215660  [mRNA]  locus=scaffold2880:231725:234547:- [translate_table: standard]